MNGPSSRARRVALLATPPVLLASTYATFAWLSAWLGPERGYLGGFLFYWLGWCLLLPLWAIGPERFRAMFRDARPRFGRPAVVGALLLLGPPVASAGGLLAGGTEGATLPVILISAAFALVNGTLEEVLWRGTYVTVFAKSWLWGYLYPSIGFGLWHLSPQVVYPSGMPGGPLAFAAMSIFLGLTYGWLVRQNGSIRWPAVSHILTDLAGLAGRSFV